MIELERVLLIIHIVAGMLALVAGAFAIGSKKGRSLHRKSGQVYFLTMTIIFLSGLILAGFRENRFLFMLSFLSYYTVFAGVRVLRLKKLHKNQKPAWYDWAAGCVNLFMNIIFLGMGLYILVRDVSAWGAALMYIGFGTGGIAISYTNLTPFFTPPNKAYHWYLAHIGNMMGGYIATFTAFLSTIVSRFDFPYPMLAFITPAILGVPVLVYWLTSYEKKLIKK